MHLSPAGLATLLGATSTVVNAYSGPADLHAFGRMRAQEMLAQQRETISTPSQDRFLNAKTSPYAVNGSGIPEVHFDLGESYAGHMSINNDTSNENALFFWYFPSNNSAADDEIVIWLNGGPGCSSLDGFFQENGPVLWQSGTYLPQSNPYSWTKLTNMVWVDQPIGTGLASAAKGAAHKVDNEKIVAEQFMGFWKNFMETFDLTGRKVYITGESYAGQYIPYIAWYMLMAKNTQYYDVKGIQINDPSIGNGIVLTDIPAYTHMVNYNNIFNLNDTFVAEMAEKNEKCGYKAYMDAALTFPPPADFPSVPKFDGGCDVWSDIVTAAVAANPCFNIYHLIDFCPYLWDVMGFPSLAGGPNNYFNRKDVQTALNVHTKEHYEVCGNPHLGLNHPGDKSPPSAFLPLPHVVEMTNNVLVGSGLLDYLLLTNGTLMTLNNMTWNGAKGFSAKPSEPFYVPQGQSLQAIRKAEGRGGSHQGVGLVAGGGLLGQWGSDRGLTFCEVDHSGHEIPQYQPGAAFRHLEFLLGRVDSLSSQAPFTVPI